MKVRMPALLLLAVSFAIEQSSAQTTPSEANASSAAHLSGRVVDADSGAAVTNVSVGSDAVGWTTTDSEGRYRLRNIRNIPSDPIPIWVAGGTRTLAGPVTKPIFVSLRQGQEVQQVDFRVRLTAQLSGRVFGQNGEPLSGIRVFAVAKRYERSPWVWKEASIGDWTYSPAGFGPAFTDDTGAYSLRIYAGRAHWILAYPQVKEEAPISNSPLDTQHRRSTLIPTFYPKAGSVETAVPVTLQSLENRSNVDIFMSTSPSYCVEALLTAEQNPASLGFGIIGEDAYRVLGDRHADWPLTGQSGPDGVIRVCGLYSGRFRLASFQSVGAMSPPSSYGTETFTVRDQDIRSVRVEAAPPVRISGEIVWDSSPTATLGESPAVIVALQRRGLGLPTRTNVLSIPSQFEIQVFANSPYRAGVGRLPDPFYIKDVTYGGSSVFNSAVEPRIGDAQLRIVIGRDAGTLSVLVSDEQGRSLQGSCVFVIPQSANSEAEITSVLSGGLTNEQGIYVATSLRPGGYYVLATEQPPPYMLVTGVLEIDATPAALSELFRARSTGRLVEVTPNTEGQVSIISRPLN